MLSQAGVGLVGPHLTPRRALKVMVVALHPRSLAPLLRLRLLLLLKSWRPQPERCHSRCRCRTARSREARAQAAALRTFSRICLGLISSRSITETPFR